MNRRRSAALILAAAAVLATLNGAYAGALRLNTTSSMPIGLWRVMQMTPAQMRHGAIVTVCLPETPTVRQGVARGYIRAGSCPNGLEPLVKPIAAIPGDIVTVDRSGISVNGAAVRGTAQLARDSGNRPLRSVAAGIYAVSAGRVWLLSGHDRRSFDSRYFGDVPVSGVQGAAQPVWVLD